MLFRSKLRDYGAAIRWAKAGLETMPNHRDCLLCLGIAQFRAGDWEAAAKSAKQAQQRSDGGDPYEWLFLAVLYQRLGHGEEAREQYKNAHDWMRTHNSRSRELLTMWTETKQELGLNFHKPRWFHHVVFAGALTSR